MFSFKLRKVSNYMPVLLSINIYARLTVQFCISGHKNCKRPTAENLQNLSEYRARWVVEEIVGFKTVVSSLSGEESPILSE